ncbi:hypothetical protein BGZ61DRAFT_436756 [Ilyonectria robusta]|uniref:uncharacterized protein n=1 Tax=Ilyonectria robusta TaxID=1079257 RepID=UPI001E8DC3B2|nr:uncharacterized protein BGZ61DRAFT_436756 [Ilyonectria robusta]KAH8736656.1 hypothetical protein BGZ61DRAFT_436756 [Ilyonectria robusta]
MPSLWLSLSLWPSPRSFASTSILSGHQAPWRPTHTPGPCAIDPHTRLICPRRPIFHLPLPRSTWLLLVAAGGLDCAFASPPCFYLLAPAPACYCGCRRCCCPELS